MASVAAARCCAEHCRGIADNTVAAARAHGKTSTCSRYRHSVDGATGSRPRSTHSRAVFRPHRMFGVAAPAPCSHSSAPPQTCNVRLAAPLLLTLCSPPARSALQNSLLLHHRPPSLLLSIIAAVRSRSPAHRRPSASRARRPAAHARGSARNRATISNPKPLSKQCCLRMNRRPSAAQTP
jgi:hypothetical protein